MLHYNKSEFTGKFTDSGGNILTCLAIHVPLILATVPLDHFFPLMSPVFSCGDMKDTRKNLVVLDALIGRTAEKQPLHWVWVDLFFSL